MCTSEMTPSFKSGLERSRFPAAKIGKRSNAANAAVEIAREGWVLEKVAKIQNRLRGALEPLASRGSVADVRVLGAIGVVEMKENIDVPAIQKELVERGAWLRPFGKLLYTMPPYIISDGELDTLLSAVSEVVK